jgi:hypothetical protein
MKYPLNELTINDGKLVHTPRYGTPSDYLTVPEVRIMKRRDFYEHEDGTDVTFMFELNTAIDETWRELFKTHLEGMPGEISNTTLEIRCIPANIEGRVQRAKDAISRTNQSYVEVKGALTTKVTELDEQRRRQKEAADDRTTTIKQQFDNLTI